MRPLVTALYEQQELAAKAAGLAERAMQVIVFIPSNKT